MQREVYRRTVETRVSITTTRLSRRSWVQGKFLGTIHVHIDIFKFNFCPIQEMHAVKIKTGQVAANSIRYIRQVEGQVPSRPIVNFNLYFNHYLCFILTKLMLYFKHGLAVILTLSRSTAKSIHSTGLVNLYSPNQPTICSKYK